MSSRFLAMLPRPADPLHVALVLDLGFGDGGKGITVDWLCSRVADPAQALVVRFAGGHQVGHTVRIGPRRHTFSNFGAGTLRGVASCWGWDTTVFPPGLVLEYQELEDLRPRLFLDPRAQVTTPYDIAWNRVTERLRRHGSCGVGHGATVVRNQAGIRFAIKDLGYDWIAAQKLLGVRCYYEERVAEAGPGPLAELWQRELAGLDETRFLAACRTARSIYRNALPAELVSGYQQLILEGNQGVLLDREEGLYPHQSWSRSTAAAAAEWLAELPPGTIGQLDIHYVTRCYQTRHGAGPLSNARPVTLENRQDETNVDNEWQGPLRIAELDPELLGWSLATDALNYPVLTRLAGGRPPERHLVLTCLDQRPDWRPEELLDRLPAFRSVQGSYSADSCGFRPLR